MVTKIKVGFIQTQPVFGNLKENLAQLENCLINSTADLVVLPELFTTGYQFKDRDEARQLAEPVPEGPTTEFLLELARFRKVTLIAGIAESAGDRLYNTAVIVGPEGYIGKYRKAHIFDTEKNIFHPGDLPLEVFDIGPVRVGVIICFDWRFPETTRTLALKGADVIAHPSNLVLPHCPQAMITRCLENRVYAITADRVGTESRLPEESLTFIGQSQIVDPDGQVLYRASEDQEEMKVVEIDIEKARNKWINERNDLFHERREDLYRLHSSG